MVKRNDETKGFVVLARRWAVERSFARLGHYHRLSKDYEYWVATFDTMLLYAASIHIMLRRLACL